MIRVIPHAFFAWTLAVLALCFAKDGLSDDNFTRLLILVFIAIQAIVYQAKQKEEEHKPSAFSYVFGCSWRALVVEFCYLFSRPLYDGLQVTRDAPLEDIIGAAAIDGFLVFPVYLVLFSVSWKLMSRFSYSLVEVLVLFGAGHAIGDGNAFFIANPALLLLLPYVMLNYQACIAVPFLRFGPRGQSSRRLRLLLPLLLLPAAYFVCGALLVVVGRALGLRD